MRERGLVAYKDRVEWANGFAAQVYDSNAPSPIVVERAHLVRIFHQTSKALSKIASCIISLRYLLLPDQRDCVPRPFPVRAPHPSRVLDVLPSEHMYQLHSVLTACLD